MLVNCYRGITTGNPEFTPCFGGHEIQVSNELQCHGKVVLFTVHLLQIPLASSFEEPCFLIKRLRKSVVFMIHSILEDPF